MNRFGANATVHTRVYWPSEGSIESSHSRVDLLRALMSLPSCFSKTDGQGSFERAFLAESRESAMLLWRNEDEARMKSTMLVLVRGSFHGSAFMDGCP